MNEEKFWQLVEQAKQQAGDDSNDREGVLEQLLMKLPLEDIHAFDRCFSAQLDKAYRWSLWGAAYVMMGGCSDDGFQDFRSWLISEGRERFEAALADPESLADEPAEDEPALEGFGYAARQAYENLSGGEMPDDDHQSPREPAGERWDEEAVGAMFPRLAKAYGFE